MTTYNKEHLYQCVRNLFAQAKYEFREIHKIEPSLKSGYLVIDEDYAVKVEEILCIVED